MAERVCPRRRGSWVDGVVMAGSGTRPDHLISAPSGPACPVRCRGAWPRAQVAGVQFGHSTALRPCMMLRWEGVPESGGVVLDGGSLRTMPLRTLKKVIRPEKGSVMVLKTTTPPVRCRLPAEGDFCASLNGSVSFVATAQTMARGRQWERARRARGRRLDEVEQVVGSHVGQALEKSTGKMRSSGWLHGARRSGAARDGALFEILLHQLVFALGDQLDQRLMAALRRRQGCWGSADFAAAVAAGV